MAENQDGQEKSQEPTSKKLTDSKKKGQIARSKELNTMAITIFGVIAIMAMGDNFTDSLSKQFKTHFILTKEEIFDPYSVLSHFIGGVQDAIVMLLPFFGVMVVVAILSSVALGGFNVSFEAMQPKLSKMNPIKGMKKIFSAKGLMELFKAMAKFSLVAIMTGILMWSWKDDIIGLSSMDLATGLKEGVSLLLWASLLLSCTMILMAAIDVPFQLWQHTKELKMTMQEVRDEMKQTEGRPEVKGRIRQMQREIAQRRMMQEVPNADVIVTNPTHYAIALKYDPEKMASPILLAKGSELIAANIRKVGEENNIPRIEAPMLARAIYYNTELNHPIPAGLFMAVAQLLAYVFQLKAYAEEGGDIPQQPQEYPIPTELQHD